MKSMFRKLIACVLSLAALGVHAQSIPNGGSITQGQVWTAAQWMAAFQAKVDVSSGTLANGTLTSPTLNSPIINSPTFNITGLTQCLHVSTSGVVSGTGADCGSGGGGSSNWSALVPGTNVSGNFFVGSGSALATSGSGTIAATSLSALTGLPSMAADTLIANPTGSGASGSATGVGGNLFFLNNVLTTGQLFDNQTGTSYTLCAAAPCSSGNFSPGGTSNPTDLGSVVTSNNASSVAWTLPQAGTAGFVAGAAFDVQNKGAGTLTITPTSSTINGQANLAVAQNLGCTITSDGTNYQLSSCPAVGSGGGGGGGSFSSLTGGTPNTSATLVIGTGATLSTDYTGQTGNTAVVGYLEENTTPATSSVFQYMCHQISGQGWGTTAAASQDTDWLICNEPTSNTTAGSKLVFLAQQAGGGYTVVLTLDSNVSGVGSQVIAGTGFAAGSISTTGSACSAGQGIFNPTTNTLGFCANSLEQGAISTTALSTKQPIVTIAGTAATIASGTGACATHSASTLLPIGGEVTCSGSTGATTITLTLPAVTTTYNCMVRDVTTSANLGYQTGALSTTSVTFSFSTLTSGDTISWSCPLAH